MGDKLEDALGAMKIASAESDGEDDAGERQEELSENHELKPKTSSKMMNCWDPSAHTTWADEMEEICAENDCEDQNQTQGETKPAASSPVLSWRRRDGNSADHPQAGPSRSTYVPPHSRQPALAGARGEITGNRNRGNDVRRNRNRNEGKQISPTGQNTAFKSGNQSRKKCSSNKGTSAKGTCTQKCCTLDHDNMPIVTPEDLKKQECAVMAARAAAIAAMRQCAAVPCVETNCYPRSEGWDTVVPSRQNTLVVAPPPYNVAPPRTCALNCYIPPPMQAPQMPSPMAQARDDGKEISRPHPREHTSHVAHHAHRRREQAQKKGSKEDAGVARESGDHRPTPSDVPPRPERVPRIPREGVIKRYGDEPRGFTPSRVVVASRPKGEVGRVQPLAPQDPAGGAAACSGVRGEFGQLVDPEYREVAKAAGFPIPDLQKHGLIPPNQMLEESVTEVPGLVLGKNQQVYFQGGFVMQPPGSNQAKPAPTNREEREKQSRMRDNKHGDASIGQNSKTRRSATRSQQQTLTTPAGSSLDNGSKIVSNPPLPMRTTFVEAGNQYQQPVMVPAAPSGHQQGTHPGYGGNQGYQSQPAQPRRVQPHSSTQLSPDAKAFQSRYQTANYGATQGSSTQGAATPSQQNMYYNSQFTPRVSTGNAGMSVTQNNTQVMNVAQSQFQRGSHQHPSGRVMFSPPPMLPAGEEQLGSRYGPVLQLPPFGQQGMPPCGMYQQNYPDSSRYGQLAQQAYYPAANSYIPAGTHVPYGPPNYQMGSNVQSNQQGARYHDDQHSYQIYGHPSYRQRGGSSTRKNKAGDAGYIEKRQK